MDLVENTMRESAVNTGSGSLEERLWRVESILEIQRLEARYSQTWDASDDEAWAALFTLDGVFHCVDLVGRPGFRHEGRAALAAFCRELQTGMQRLHLITTYDIEVDADRARGRTTFECHRTAVGDHPFVGLVTGWYQTDYVCTEEGWRIAHRTEHLVFNREERYFAEVAAQ
jgi:uncharacterized protein (TIGR02246 family)